MSATNSPKMFAFGANFLGGGCECPALAAGFTPEDSDLPGMDSIINRYDDLLRDEHESWDGEVSEEEAKDAWVQAMEEIEQSKYDNVEAGEAVAKHHDWI